MLAASTARIERDGITLLGISLTNLAADEPRQLLLPFDRHDAAVLDATVDSVRERFGTASVTRAVLVGRDQGLSVPMLPD